jgi:hypothetical protein
VDVRPDRERDVILQQCWLHLRLQIVRNLNITSPRSGTAVVASPRLVHRTVPRNDNDRILRTVNSGQIPACEKTLSVSLFLCVCV